MINKVTLKTPFRLAKKYVGIEPRDCLILDRDYVNKLLIKKGENTRIIIDVDYKQFNLKEKRVVTIAKIRELVQSGRAKINYKASIGKYAINLDRNDCDIAE